MHRVSFHRVSFISPVIAAITLVSALTVTTSTTFAGSVHRPAVDAMDDIKMWYGEGSNEAALVLDWNDGKSPQALAWGYRFDGSGSRLDMFNAIVQGDSRLYAKVGTVGTAGLPVYGLGRDMDFDGFAITDATDFTRDGMVTTSPADGASPTDAGDHYEEGWFSEGFWSQYDGTGNPYDGGSWGFGGGLTSTANLGDGAWVGLSYAPAFDFTTPSSAAAAVPTPSAALAGMTLLGGMLMCRRRRSARDASRQ